MNKPFGPALMSCISQNEKFRFEGLSRDHGDVSHHNISEFQTLARDVSIPWHQIYYAIYITDKLGKGNLSLLRWLIVHILYQSGSGHLRSDLSDFEVSLDKWFFMEREYFPGSEREFDEKTRTISDIKGRILEEFQDILLENTNLFGSEDSLTPFIYRREQQILYMRKYYKMEKQLLKSFDLFSQSDSIEDGGELENQVISVTEELNRSRSFPLSEKTIETTVKLLNKRLVILSGGPGTGKTTTVTAIVRILKMLESRQLLPPVKRIRLAAPTGRAANRMIESIRLEMKENPLEGIDNLLPEKAYTLHKLLGINPMRKEVLYNKDRPIPAELIILDEASMVDARMMSLLFDSLSPTACLLLVGDKDQLPSIDAGAVFGDIVTGAESENHKLHHSVVFLEKSWRSSKKILQIAEEVIKGSGQKALELLKSENDTVFYKQLSSSEKMVTLVMDKYGIKDFAGPGKGFYYLKDPASADPVKIDRIFRIFENFALLIPTRRGEYGVERINNRINQLLTGREQALYHGQPIMIRVNDYNLSLFNGDRGVILNFGGEFYSVFRDGPDSFRYIPAGKLNAYETSYAQTIHKSQGSEFLEVMVLIPEGSERLLTREIVYTGITRAKEKLTVFSSDQLLTEAVSRQVIRHSGIREYLGGNSGI